VSRRWNAFSERVHRLVAASRSTIAPGYSFVREQTKTGLEQASRQAPCHASAETSARTFRKWSGQSSFDTIGISLLN